MGKDHRACDSMLRPMRGSGSGSCVAMAGGVNPAARCRTWKSIINNFGATRGTIPSKTNYPLLNVSRGHPWQAFIEKRQFGSSDSN
jgi:hypothetical protein